MTGTAARSKSTSYVLPEFLARPKSSRFRGSSVDLLASEPTPAAGVASWICVHIAIWAHRGRCKV